MTRKYLASSRSLEPNRLLAEDLASIFLNSPGPGMVVWGRFAARLPHPWRKGPPKNTTRGTDPGETLPGA